MSRRQFVVIAITIAASAGCVPDADPHDGSPSTTALAVAPPTMFDAPADGGAAMCAEVVEVDGQLYFRDRLLRVSQLPMSKWENLGQIVGPYPCDDTGEPEAGSADHDRITASAALIGASVYLAPTEAGVVMVDTSPAALLYHVEGANRLGFTSQVVEISLNTPELLEGSGTPARRLSTITDVASIDELMTELLAADRIDSFHADNLFDFVVELVRDDGLVTSLGLDSHANVLNDRALGPVWAAAVAGLS